MTGAHRDLFSNLLYDVKFQKELQTVPVVVDLRFARLWYDIVQVLDFYFQ